MNFDLDYWPYLTFDDPSKNSSLTLIRAGGGGEPDIRREIGCHFSQEPPRDLRILDFFKNDVGPRLKESFEHTLNDYLENGSSSTKIYTFFEAKIINFNFFKNFEI